MKEQMFTVSSPPWMCVLYTVLLGFGNTLGLLGNILVMMATYNKSDSFKLDPSTVIFLRHLALADLIFIILYPLPMTLTYGMQRWFYGEWACRIMGHLVSIPVLANINFILVISFHRYVRCRFPHRVHQLTPKMTVTVAALIWAISCLFLFVTVFGKYDSVFNGVLAACTFVYSKSVVNCVLIIFSTAVPFTLIVAVNIALWCHVRSFDRRTAKFRTSQKHSTSESIKSAPDDARKSTISRMSSLQRLREFGQGLAVPNRAAITTTAVTSLFTVTWMPTVVRFMYSSFAGEERIPPWLEQLRYLYFLGSWGNPVLYGTINKGFRDYLMKFCYQLCRVYLVEPTREASVRVSGSFNCVNLTRMDSFYSRNSTSSKLRQNIVDQPGMESGIAPISRKVGSIDENVPMC